MVRTQTWSNKWGSPGGKIQRGETSTEALVREILEETRLPIDHVEFALVQDCIEPVEFYRSAHFLLLNYIARTASTEVVLNDEAFEWQWIEPEKSLQLDLNQPTRILVDFYLTRQSRPR
jgi:8-oxo-dGTP pyrophosphatase MutT (NUDIX family)